MKTHLIFPENYCSSALRARMLSPKMSRLSKMSFFPVRLFFNMINA